MSLQAMPRADGQALEFAEAAGNAAVDRGRRLFDLLREKWHEVPGGLMGRVDTEHVLGLSDWELRDFWRGVHHEASTGPAYPVRGWYHELYRDQFRGKRVLEVGSGMGIDALHFIAHGAKWHFADIAPSNLRLIRRLLDAFGYDCDGITYVEDLGSLDALPGDFDFIFCHDALTRLPFAFARHLALHLLPHLTPGGRWIELCYPRARWERDRRPPFADWGRVTDGDETPWAEWYDRDRLAERFAPAQFAPLLAFDFYNDDFNWFDLRFDAVPDRQKAMSYLSGAGRASHALGLQASAFQVHPGSEIAEQRTAAGTALRVRTSPRIWSYAAHGTIGAATLGQIVPPGAEDVLPVIEADVLVTEGHVGVGILADDLQNFVGQERLLVPRDAPYKVVLPCPAGLAKYRLMFRNAMAGDVRSEFAVTRLALACRSAEELTERQSDGVDGPVIPLSAIVRRHWATIARENEAPDAPQPKPDVPVFVRAVAIDELDRALGHAEPSRGIATDRGKDFRAWKMETDDAPILAYLYRNHRPARHLEFGTWEGFGATLCATNCDAEVWTLNHPDGERNAAGQMAYSRQMRESEERPDGATPIEGDGATYQTDAGAFIGWRYRKAGLAHRVHQILADSREWDPRDFAPGFFDSILIDGGHHSDVVASDTEKALPLLRPGGLMLWHDFCPAEGPMTDFPATRGVVNAVHRQWRTWSRHFVQIFWIRPSYVLLGVKR
ncbi:MAG: class I SAM-dependent methyltransferase [Alphaproteobacteria bacterium]|nr:class I SAM-dependent methyltransferase [Alphaproteobacteria bacterium]